MRSYGVVQSRFWPWAREQGLSPEARTMALYLLTGPHTTGIGCFRLPVGYIVEDLGSDAGTVRATLAELSAIGFLEYDAATGWVWIVGFLDHNPIANPNVAKSLVPYVRAVPGRLPFHDAFLDALERRAGRFPDGLIDGLRNRSPNPMPNQDQEQEPDPEPEHDPQPQPEPQPEPEALRAFEAWQAAAERVGRWPRVTKLHPDRRNALRARIAAAGGLARFLAVLERAEASRFCREEMTSFSLDWFLKAGNFRKVQEGNYDDSRQPARPSAHTAAAGPPRSRAAMLADMVDRLRGQEERAHGV